MRQGGKRVSRSEGAGVLDAGIVLARLDRLHKSHHKAVELFRRSAGGSLSLAISVVNLAEVLQHSRRYIEATGVDPVDLLRGFKVDVHGPDVDIARRVAALTTLEGASLADRFAAATAEAMSARLYTTDRALGIALRSRQVPVTLW